MDHPDGSPPGRVRAGYALGSLVTGAFGAVPGLLLLSYLTDTLGVAAGIAGLLVLAPKAWDVLINPLPGGSPIVPALPVSFLSLLQRPSR